MKSYLPIVTCALIFLGIFFAGCTNSATTANPHVQTLSTIKTAGMTTYTHSPVQTSTTIQPIGTTTVATYQPTLQTTTVPSSSSTAVQIRITYTGAWSGSYYCDGTSSSVDGTGSKIITLENAKGIVSTSFQKQDSSQNELKVEILNNGDVVKSGTTTASYGVVAIASSLSNVGSTTSSSSSKVVQIKVNYNEKWSGAYGEVGAITSVEGSGYQTYTISNPNYAVSATFQKKDGSTSELSVEIIEDGNVLKSGSTTAAYGVVAISTQI